MERISEMPQYATLYLQYCMGHAYNASRRITRFWRWGDLRIDLWSEDNTKALYRRSLAGWMFGTCRMRGMGEFFLANWNISSLAKNTNTRTFSRFCLAEPYRFFLWASQMRSKMVPPHALWHVFSKPSFRAATRHRRAAYSVLQSSQCVRNYVEVIRETDRNW